MKEKPIAIHTFIFDKDKENKFATTHLITEFFINAHNKETFITEQKLVMCFDGNYTTMSFGGYSKITPEKLRKLADELESMYKKVQKEIDKTCG